MSSILRHAALAVALGTSPLLAQQSGAHPALTEAEFARIEQLGAIALSPDGKWIAYDFRRGVSGPTELRYRAVAGGTESIQPLGNTPVFSANSRWLLFTVTPDTANAGRAGSRRGGAPATGRGAVAESAHANVGIVDLRTGTTVILDDIQAFSLSKDGAHVALRRYPPADAHG